MSSWWDEAVEERYRGKHVGISLVQWAQSYISKKELLISVSTAINFFETKFFDILSGIMKSSIIFQLFFNYFLFFFQAHQILCKM